MSEKLLMIGMPCYGCQMHIDATQSLIEMISVGLKYQWIAIGNESLISRARNNTLAYFYHNKEFTHLLFLDADIYLSGLDTKKLLDSGKDVVGAGVRLKSKNIVYNFNSTRLDANGEPPKEGDIYYKVDKLGTAAIMLSRKAVDDIVNLAKTRHSRMIELNKKMKDILKDYPTEYDKILHAKDIADILNVTDGVGYVYGRSSILMGGSLANNMPTEYYDVHKVGVKNDIYLSEDYYLCNDLKELGYDIYVDRTIKTRHNGILEFE